VKPKLSIVKAQSMAAADPQILSIKTAKEFNDNMNRFGRKFSSCFDTKYFDPHSIIWTLDYSPQHAEVGKRQFLEFEINIDTVNAIDNKNQPAPNRNTGKIEMYSFKDFEKHIQIAVDKVLSMELFDQKKGIVSFAAKKSDK
jgi:hypothetical protein